MNILRKVKWQFPPRVRKCGTPIEEHDVKELIILHSDYFGQQPVIAMSDIHAQTQNVLDKLDQKFLLSRCVVLTAGDMAGTLTMGTDGDPTTFYQQLSNKCQEFYFVQGNHDMPDQMNLEKKLTTVNGTPCMIPNGQTVNTSIGKIGGVNGIISDKHHPYKLSESDYLKHLTRALEKRPSILLTHDTPALPSLIGNPDIYKLVTKYRPKIHMYGHCHHREFYHYLNGTHYFNLDGRILVFIPTRVDLNSLLKETDLT